MNLRTVPVPYLSLSFSEVDVTNKYKNTRKDNRYRKFAYAFKIMFAKYWEQQYPFSISFLYIIQQTCFCILPMVLVTLKWSTANITVH